MVIEIDGKEYELHFGWDFIETMNHLNGIVVEGVHMNTGGLYMLQGQLDMGDPIAVLKALQGGTSTYASKPSKKSLQKYVEELIANDEYDDFLKELLTLLDTQPLTKAVIKNQEKKVENQAKQA